MDLAKGGVVAGQFIAMDFGLWRGQLGQFIATDLAKGRSGGATWAIYCHGLWAAAGAIYCHGLSKGGRRGGATCCRRLWAAAEGNLGNLLPWTSKGGVGAARVRCVNADSIVLVTNA